MEWFAALSFEDITNHTKNLELYVELAFILGPRSTEAIRIQTGSTINTMIGGDHGGQLALAIKMHYYPSGHSAIALSPECAPQLQYQARAWPRSKQKHRSRSRRVLT